MATGCSFGSALRPVCSVTVPLHDTTTWFMFVARIILEECKTLWGELDVALQNELEHGAFIYVYIYIYIYMR